MAQFLCIIMYYIGVDGPLLSTYLSIAVSSILTRKVDIFFKPFMDRLQGEMIQSRHFLGRTKKQLKRKNHTGLNQIWWGKVL